MKRQHKTKWTVWYIRTGKAERFSNEEDARSHVLMWCNTPVAIYPPIYGE